MPPHPLYALLGALARTYLLWLYCGEKSRTRTRYPYEALRALLRMASSCQGPPWGAGWSIPLVWDVPWALSRAPCPPRARPRRGCHTGHHADDAPGAPRGLAAPPQALRVLLRPQDEGAQRLGGGLRHHHQRGGDNCVSGRFGLPDREDAKDMRASHGSAGSGTGSSATRGRKGACTRSPSSSARPSRPHSRWCSSCAQAGDRAHVHDVSCSDRAGLERLRNGKNMPVGAHDTAHPQV